MRIAVPIKQVPETSNVKMDPETGTMIRDGLVSIVNPLDLYAVETALQIKDANKAEITAFTMGPPAAEAALREVVAMGCDTMALLTDKKFAGADTWATSYVIAGAIQKDGPFDLIICGERAVDGDTGQVGPGIAAWLDIPCVTYVQKIVDINSTAMTVERLIEEGMETLEIKLPALITVIKEAGEPRLPTLRGKQRARKVEPLLRDASALQLDPSFLGLKGSPTRVVKITSPKVSRNGTLYKPETEKELMASVDACAEYILEVTGK